jgi:plastocyanin
VTRRGRIAISAGAVLIVVTATAVFAANGGSDDDTGSLRVSMTEYDFDPSPIVLPADVAALRVVNYGDEPHSLLVLGLGKGTPELATGEEMTVDLSDEPAGTYVVVCDVAGHRALGMETRLTLE